MKLDGLHFSLSGMENQVKKLLERGEKPADIARFALNTVCDVVHRATVAARDQYPGLPVLCSGGVASNRHLLPCAHRVLSGHLCPAPVCHRQRYGDSDPYLAGLERGGTGMTGERTVLTPSQVGGYLKNLMDRDRLLSSLLVRGELSNYKMYPSGHHYFTLKDSEGALRCVMFRGDAQSLRFRPENGMQVLAAGRITVFPRDGQYQMYCVRLTPDGAGDLARAFEQLKERLLRRGCLTRA